MRDVPRTSPVCYISGFYRRASRRRRVETMRIRCTSGRICRVHHVGRATNMALCHGLYAVACLVVTFDAT